jgi:hypothetical protein
VVDSVPDMYVCTSLETTTRAGIYMVLVRTCGPGGYGMKPEASSRVTRRTAACGSRADREYSDYTAVTGCIACACRIAPGDASHSPMWPTLPSPIRSPSATTVPSIGIMGPPRCW